MQHACLFFVIFLEIAFVCGKVVITVQIEDTASAPPPRLFPNWNVTTKQDSSQTSVLQCPRGRYCPLGSAKPVQCPLGTFSQSTGSSVACSGKCPKNFFCPDPAQRVPCPEHTWSNEGAVSKGDCLCEGGYICTYQKEMIVNMVLNLPFEMWLRNQTLQQQLKVAVANAAGVPVGKVAVDKILPVVGGRGRRNIQGTMQVCMRVLDSKRQNRRIETHLVTDQIVHSFSVSYKDHVLVRKKPDLSKYMFKFFEP